MAKMTENSRNKLLKILDTERSEERCQIVRDLTVEAKELTADIDEKFEAPESAIADAEAEIREHKEFISDLKSIKEKRLAEAKLGNLTQSGRVACTVGDVHPDLEAFDKETMAKEKEILML